MIDYKKYTFGFTAASLRLSDFVVVAKHKRDGEVLDHVNMLGAGKTATGSRMLIEYAKRLSTLTSEQIDILVDGILPSQKQIAFLAICKTNAFIRDFTVEVLREKMLLFDYEVSDGEFLTFLRRKTETHAELEAISEKTNYKVKQVTFKILEQAGIIDSIKSRNILPQLVDRNVIRAIANDNKEWLKVLLLSDSDINNV
jgi:hypothetical protein